MRGDNDLLIYYGLDGEKGRQIKINKKYSRNRLYIQKRNNLDLNSKPQAHLCPKKAKDGYQERSSLLVIGSHCSATSQFHCRMTTSLGEEKVTLVYQGQSLSVDANHLVGAREEWVEGR